MQIASHSRALSFAYCLALLVMGSGLFLVRDTALAVSGPTNTTGVSNGVSMYPVTIVSAVRTSKSNVHVTWTATTRSPMYFIVLFVNNDDTTPPADPFAQTYPPGASALHGPLYSHVLALDPAARAADVTVGAAFTDVEHHNYFMVCQGNHWQDEDPDPATASPCSRVVVETAMKNTGNTALMIAPPQPAPTGTMMTLSGHPQGHPQGAAVNASANTVMAPGALGPVAPVAVSALRSSSNRVHITWTYAGANPKKFYLFRSVASSMPSANWEAGGWSNDLIVEGTARQADLSTPAASKPQHTYYLVCVAGAGSSYACSGVLTEEASMIAPAPLSH